MLPLGDIDATTTVHSTNAQFSMLESNHRSLDVASIGADGSSIIQRRFRSCSYESVVVKKMPHLLVRSITFCALFVTLCMAQVFVGTNGSETNASVYLPPMDGLSSNCNSTFTSNIMCDTTLPSIAFQGYFPTDDDLAALCNSGCLQSLDSLRGVQVQACASDIVKVNGDVYPATATIDALLWTYNYTCRRDESGNFCAPVFDAWANGNDNQSSCTDCVLGTFQIQISHPFRYNNAVAARYSSLTSSCQATGYPLTSPAAITISQTPTSTATVSSGASTPSCSTSYTVIDGDCCHSISERYNVSTASLLQLNGLQAGCTNFPPTGSELCLPYTCEIYTVQENDTCWSIVRSYNDMFTVTQLNAWNVEINVGCDNLEMVVGNQICVSFPGEIPQASPTNTTMLTTAASVPTNIANGTNSYCAKYYDIRDGDTCASLSMAQGISLKDFYFLNPTINQTSCDNLLAGEAYCVEAVGSIQTYASYGGRSSNSCLGGTTTADASCYATTYPTADPWTFPTYNAAAANASSPTAVSVNYSSTTNMPSSASADVTPTAGSIVLSSTISDTTLAISTPPTNGSMVSVTGTSPPGPTQTGEPLDCYRWVAQVDGQYCQDMASRAGISLSCLYQMNPGLNTSTGECQGLWTGYAYCVGTTSNTCF